MNEQTKKVLLIGGAGVGVLAVAYVLSTRKGSSETQQTVQQAQQSAGVVPIPALLAQSSARAANNVATSNPIPQNVSVPTQQATQQAQQSGGLSEFYSKYGLRPYTVNDPYYEQYKGSYNALLDLGNNSLLQVPTYVKDKTTLLQHLSIVQQSNQNAQFNTLLAAKVAQVNAA